MTPLVSILCLAYNQEAYIRRTLDSFVMQQTDFPFEAIVHDDASPDGTAAVIREFEERYPEIIKPIYQSENQYSKPNTPIIQTFLLPRARGRYLAICEGDDWFTDPSKLQRQVSFMEAHPEYSICVHRALRHQEDGRVPDSFYPAEEEDRDFSRQELFVKGAGLFATNSFLVRRDVYETLPDAFFVSGVGDYPLLIYAAIQGKCRYLAAPMSVHNEGVKSSWTADIWRDAPAHLAHEEVMMDMLDRVDALYEGRYHEEIEEAKAYRRHYMAEYQFEYLKETGRVREAKDIPQLQPLYRAYTRGQLRARIKKCLPFLAKLRNRGKVHE